MCFLSLYDFCPEHFPLRHIQRVALEMRAQVVTVLLSAFSQNWSVMAEWN
jgi:hypothetical protein